MALEWPRRHIYCSLFTAVAILSVLGVLLSFRMQPVHAYRWHFLMSASASFLLAAILGGALRSAHGRLILTGLLCCAIGDYLGFHDFIWGVTAFLVAHVFFVAAFWTMGVDLRRTVRFMPLVLLIDLAILVWFKDGILSGDRPLVFAYIVVISAMVLFAFSVSPPQRRTLIMLAAALFYLSDIFVARWRFTDTGAINGYFCYPVYYAACVLFAWTACVYAEKRPVAVRGAG